MTFGQLGRSPLPTVHSGVSRHRLAEGPVGVRREIIDRKMRYAGAMRAWLALGLFTTIAAFGACGKDDASSSNDRVCTPGAYVFCRCEDRAEGTKLCSADGKSFDACDCGEAQLSPDGDAGFTPFDAGAPQPGAPVLPTSCAGKLALIASSDSEIDLYAALYTGNGAFSVGKSRGPALRSFPSAAIVDGTLVAVWLSRYKLLAWTKFAPGQVSFAPPVSVGSAVSSDGVAPAITGAAATARLLYLGDDDTHHEGIYGATTGWDDATAIVPTPVLDGGPTFTGKSAPAVATVGADITLAYVAGGSVLTQSFMQNAWTDPVVVMTGASVEAPSLASLDGAHDLLLVYQGADLVLRYLLRNAATKAWSTPAIIDTTASADDRPELAPMTNGRAMLVWTANGHPFFSAFDASAKKWTLPSSILVGKNPAVVSTPTVTMGRCGSEATAAYAESDGNVAVVQYANGAWNGPYPVTGLTKMTFVGVGELP